MGKTKGIVTTFYAGKEIKEWLRKASYVTRKSQAQIIREALKEYRKKHDDIYMDEKFIAWLKKWIIELGALLRNHLVSL